MRSIITKTGHPRAARSFHIPNPTGPDQQRYGQAGSSSREQAVSNCRINDEGHPERGLSNVGSKAVSLAVS
jgi:hypothetical protein